MKDLKTYPEGTPFTGTIGRTAASSSPRGRCRRAPGAGAERAGVPARRRRLRAARLLRRRHRDADLRRLAARGLRYRDFHTTAICSPTRACLLTGRNHHSNGVGIIQEMATGFGLQRPVPKENGFLSEMLLAQGTRPSRIGKWHLTLAGEYASGASKARPLARGFERYYGFIGGKTSQWSPTLIHDNHYSSCRFTATRAIT